jgi:hypothetical protein
MFNNPKKSREENGRGQAKGQNQFRVQEVQSGRQAQGQGGRMVRQAFIESRTGKDQNQED